LIRWFSRYCITDKRNVNDALGNEPGLIGLEISSPLEMPAVSLNSEDYHEPLRSPNVAQHEDYLDKGAIFTEIEDAFRPATDAVDLIALKSVMGGDFREEFVQEIEVSYRA
jgi:hypothetical protein